MRGQTPTVDEEEHIMSKATAYSWVQAAWTWRHRAIEPTLDCWAWIDQGRIRACNALVASLIDQGAVPLTADPAYWRDAATCAYGAAFVAGFICGQAGFDAASLPAQDVDTLDGFLCGQHARRNVLRQSAETKQRQLV